ncbi:neuralized-like protein 4 [Sarotherodon galilaeus]
MRGLTLLCLVGFILTALLHKGSTAPAQNNIGYLPARPMEGTNGTSNSTVPQEESGENKVFVQWNGTIRPVESDFGFPPTEPLQQSPPKDTKVRNYLHLREGSTAPAQNNLCHGCWHSLEGTRDATKSAGGNDTQNKTLHLHPNNSTHAGNATEVHHNNTAAATVKEDV